MKLGSDEIFYINTFSSISGVMPKDVLVQGNSIVFLVKKGDAGKAIGKAAGNVKVLSKKLKKNVEIVEHREKLGEFLKKALYSVNVKGIKFSENDGKKTAFVVLEGVEKRKLLNSMGRFKRIKEMAKRNYGVDEVRIR